MGDLEPGCRDNPAGIGSDAGQEEVVALGMRDQWHGKAP